jgi:hypothetical protein
MRGQPTAAATHPKHHWKPYALFFCGVVLAYVAGAYFIAPAHGSGMQRHPSLVDVPNITHAGDGEPGDPLNVSLIGTKRELIKIILAAGLIPLIR